LGDSTYHKAFQKLQADSAKIFRKTEFRLFARAENRNSRIGGRPVDLLGVMIGINIHEHHVIAGGFYFLSRTSINQRFNFDPISVQLRNLRYYNFSYQPILIQKRYYQINLPLEVGLGRYDLIFFEPGVDAEPIEGSFIPASIGVQIILKPISWLGISFLGGYRNIPLNESVYNFNGPYYSLGIWVDVRHWYRKGRYYFAKNRFRKQVATIQ